MKKVLIFVAALMVLAVVFMVTAKPAKTTGMKFNVDLGDSISIEAGKNKLVSIGVETEGKPIVGERFTIEVTGCGSVDKIHYPMSVGDAKRGTDGKAIRITDETGVMVVVFKTTATDAGKSGTIVIRSQSGESKTITTYAFDGECSSFAFEWSTLVKGNFKYVFLKLRRPDGTFVLPGEGYKLMWSGSLPVQFPETGFFNPDGRVIQRFAKNASGNIDVILYRGEIQRGQSSYEVK